MQIPGGQDHQQFDVGEIFNFFRIDPFFICVIAAAISKRQFKRAIGRGS
jgi:hypothetical protein